MTLASLKKKKKNFLRTSLRYVLIHTQIKIKKKNNNNNHARAL